MQGHATEGQDQVLAGAGQALLSFLSVWRGFFQCHQAGTYASTGSLCEACTYVVGTYVPPAKHYSFFVPLAPSRWSFRARDSAFFYGRVLGFLVLVLD